MKQKVSFECQNVVVEIPEEELIEYVKRNLYPGDLFDEKDLHDWADQNGYKKEY